MNRKKISSEELLTRAKANDYEQDAHYKKDSLKNNIKYVRKTFKDQNCVLKQYER